MYYLTDTDDHPEGWADWILQPGLTATRYSLLTIEPVRQSGGMSGQAGGA